MVLSHQSSGRNRIGYINLKHVDIKKYIKQIIYLVFDIDKIMGSKIKEEFKGSYFKYEILWNLRRADWINKKTFDFCMKKYKKWSLDKLIEFIVQNSGNKITLSLIEEGWNKTSKLTKRFRRGDKYHEIKDKFVIKYLESQ